jgi:phage gpG-like protein
VSAWQGDLSELGRLADNLARLGAVPSVASREAAKGISRAIDDQFDAQVDPYGKAWAPLKESTIERKGDDAILSETGKLRGGIHVLPRPGAGIDVTIDAEYAGFHQTGFTVGKTHVPARKILPDAAIPDTWERTISDALDSAWERAQ